MRLTLSKVPNRVVVSFSPEDGNRSSFRNFISSSYLEFRTMGKVQKPSDPDCYAPLSEPFRFLLEYFYYDEVFGNVLSFTRSKECTKLRQLKIRVFVTYL
jgi:hypothetical protein